MKSQNNQPTLLDVCMKIMGWIFVAILLFGAVQKCHAQPAIRDSLNGYVYYKGDTASLYPDTISAYFQVSYCPTCAVATKEGVRVGGQNYYYSTALFNRKKLIPFKSCWIVWGWRRKV